MISSLSFFSAAWTLFLWITMAAATMASSTTSTRITPTGTDTSSVTAIRRVIHNLLNQIPNYCHDHRNAIAMRIILTFL